MDTRLEEPTPSVRTPSLRFPWPEPQRYGLFSTVAISLAIYVVAYYVGYVAAQFGQVAASLKGDMDGLLSGAPNPESFIGYGQGLGAVWGPLVLCSVGMVMLWYVVNRGGTTASDYFGSRLPAVLFVLLHCAALTLWFAMVLGISLLLGGTPGHDYLLPLLRTWRHPALVAIPIVFVAPLFEESFYRGFLFSGIARSPLDPWAAIMTTAVLWALLHVPQYGLISVVVIFVTGVYFGWLRLRTGSIWLSVLLHAIWNGLSYGVTLLALGNVF